MAGACSRSRYARGVMASGSSPPSRASDQHGAPVPAGTGSRTGSPATRGERPVRSREARRQLRTALEEAISLLGGDGGFVYLLSHDGESLAMTMSSGLDLTAGGRALQRVRLPARDRHGRGRDARARGRLHR